MSVAAAEIFVTVLAAYFGIGVLFALLFVVFGAGKIDPTARRMPVRVRALILPGVAILWPLMAVKWLRQTEPPIS